MTSSSDCEESPAKFSKFFDLPPEILWHIPQHLDTPIQIANLAATCKFWNKVATRPLYELDAELNGGKSLFWALSHRRREPILRAAVLGIDIFQMQHLEYFVSQNDTEIVTALAESGHLHRMLISKLSSKTVRSDMLRRLLESRDIDMLRLLVDHGPNPGKDTYSQGCSFLSVAAEINHSRMFHMLMNMGATYLEAWSVRGFRTDDTKRREVLSNVSNPASFKSRNQGYNHGYRRLPAVDTEPHKLFLSDQYDPVAFELECQILLHSAALCGNFTVFKILVENGANIISPITGKGSTLLHASTSLDITKMLLEANHVIDSLSARFETPLTVACKSGRMDLVETLLGAGAHLEGLIDASLESVAGSNAVLQETYQSSIPVRTRQRHFTPLDAAARQDHVDIVRLLISRGANAYGMGSIPRPMNEAIFYSTAVLQLMIDAGADINAKQSNGDTVFHAVARSRLRNKRPLFEKFLNLNADTEARNNWGDTVLHLITREGGISDLTALPMSKMHINSLDASGWTPLMIACHRRHGEMALYLLQNGADAKCTVANKPEGDTALHIAIRANAPRAVFIELLKAGAYFEDCWKLCTDRLLKAFISCLADTAVWRTGARMQPMRKRRHGGNPKQ